jgi:hypothetical protein
MLEIKHGINAGQVNSGSTAKCLKTQSFYSQVNSSHSTPASILRCRRRSGCVLSGLTACSEGNGVCSVKKR